MSLPSRLFLTKGVGVHKEKLTSFELALRAAGIAEFNLVRVSSIFPPGCEIVSLEVGKKDMRPGQIVHCVLYDNATNEKDRLVAASIGLALPEDKGVHGYLSEHKSFGETEGEAGEYAEDMAAEMLATILGVTDFDPDKSYDELRQVWKMSDKIVDTMHIAQEARGQKNRWVTVLAGAIFVE